MNRKRMAVGGICLSALLLDRLTKAWAALVLKGGGAITAIPGVVSFRYAENPGAAFSLMSGMRGFTALLTLALLIFLAVFLFLHKDNKPMLLSGAAVIAGGASHLYDRLLGRNIVDFIRLDFIDFPIFNVADICICVGTALLAFFYLREDSAKRSDKP